MGVSPLHRDGPGSVSLTRARAQGKRPRRRAVGVTCSNGHKTTGFGAGCRRQPHWPRGGTLAGARRDVDGPSVALDTRTTLNDGCAARDCIGGAVATWLPDTPAALKADFTPDLGAARSCGHLDGARGSC